MHDVTIALYSRIFYNAQSLDEFPGSVRGEIKQDTLKPGPPRFFEDFFRIVYQNERYEDWTPTLIILKRLIKEYRDYILNYHKRHLSSIEDTSATMPECFLSSAAEGNFLETLNLSSSVFERHYIDRPFDRTGMMSLVITPGNGIFEVSRGLAQITRERVIDNGIGSDLVCLGEQPLHAVPLFKYGHTSTDSFSIPNWINLSFYKSSEIIRFCNSTFLPSSKIRIKKSETSQSCSHPGCGLTLEAILPGYTVSHDKENYLRSLEETDNIFEKMPLKYRFHSDSVSGKISFPSFFLAIIAHFLVLNLKLNFIQACLRSRSCQRQTHFRMPRKLQQRLMVTVSKKRQAELQQQTPHTRRTTSSWRRPRRPTPTRSCRVWSSRRCQCRGVRGRTCIRCGATARPFFRITLSCRSPRAPPPTSPSSCMWTALAWA
jgi:hypothetical protein